MGIIVSRLKPCFGVVVSKLLTTAPAAPAVLLSTVLLCAACSVDETLRLVKAFQVGHCLDVCALCCTHNQAVAVRHSCHSLPVAKRQPTGGFLVCMLGIGGTHQSSCGCVVCLSIPVQLHRAVVKASLTGVKVVVCGQAVTGACRRCGRCIVVVEAAHCVSFGTGAVLTLCCGCWLCVWRSLPFSLLFLAALSSPMSMVRCAQPTGRRDQPR